MIILVWVRFLNRLKNKKNVVIIVGGIFLNILPASLAIELLDEVVLKCPR